MGGNNKFPTLTKDGQWVVTYSIENPADKTVAEIESATGAINLIAAGTCTVKASVAAVKGKNTAAEASYTLIVTDPTYVPAPTITPNGGVVYIDSSVTLECTDTGATIKYSLDGSVPSKVYTAPIVLSTIGTTTISAQAVRGVYVSDIVTATFTVTEAPVIKTAKLVPMGSTETGENIKKFTTAGTGNDATGTNLPYTFEDFLTLDVPKISSYYSYVSETEFRFYANAKANFIPAEGITLNKLSFTNTNSTNTPPTIKANIGKIDKYNNDFTWEGNATTANPLVLTFDKQTRCKYIEIEYIEDETPRQVVSDPVADDKGVITVDKNGTVTFSSKNATALWVSKDEETTTTRVTDLPYVYTADTNNTLLKVWPEKGSVEYNDKALEVTVKWYTPTEMTVTPALKNGVVTIAHGEKVTFEAQYASGFNVYLGDDTEATPQKLVVGEDNTAEWTPTEICEFVPVTVVPLDYDDNEVGTAALTFRLTVTDPTVVADPEFNLPTNIIDESAELKDPYYVGQTVKISCTDSRAKIQIKYRRGGMDDYTDWVDYETLAGQDGIELVTPGITYIKARAVVEIAEGEHQGTHYSAEVEINYYVSARPIARTISIVAQNAATKGNYDEGLCFTVDETPTQTNVNAKYSNMKGFKAGDLIELDVYGKASNTRPCVNATIDNGNGKFRLFANSTVTFKPQTGVAIKKITLTDTNGNNNALVTSDLGSVSPDKATKNATWVWTAPTTDAQGEIIGTHDPVTLSFGAAMRCDYFEIELDDKADEPLAVIASPEAIDDVITVEKDGIITFTCEAAESLLLKVCEDEDNIENAETVELIEQPWTYTATEDMKYVYVVPKAYGLEYHDKALGAYVEWGTPSEITYEAENGVYYNDILTVAQDADITFYSRYATGFYLYYGDEETSTEITANEDGLFKWKATEATNSENGVYIIVTAIGYDGNEVGNAMIGFTLIVHAPDKPADVTFTPTFEEGAPEDENFVRVAAGTEITLNGCIHSDYINYVIVYGDGTRPEDEALENGTKYDPAHKPTVDRAMTIYARSYNVTDDNIDMSEITSMSYRLLLPGTPTIDPDEGELTAGTLIKIECEGAAQIEYIINDEESTKEIVDVETSELGMPYIEVEMPEYDMMIEAWGINADGEKSNESAMGGIYTYKELQRYKIVNSTNQLDLSGQYLLLGKYKSRIDIACAPTSTPGSKDVFLNVATKDNDATAVPRYIDIDPESNPYGIITLDKVGDKYTIKIGDYYICLKEFAAVGKSADLSWSDEINPENYSKYLFDISFEDDENNDNVQHVKINISNDSGFSNHILYNYNQGTPRFKTYNQSTAAMPYPYLYRYRKGDKVIDCPEQLHIHGSVNPRTVDGVTYHWDFYNPHTGNNENGAHKFTGVIIHEMDGGFGHIVFSDWKAESASPANAPRKVYARAESEGGHEWNTIHENGGTIYAPESTQIVDPTKSTEAISLKPYTAEDGEAPIIMLPSNKAYDFTVDFNGADPTMTVERNTSIQTGVEAVIVDSNDVEWYNLQGVRIEHPAPGAVYIRRQGNVSVKIAL